MIQAVDAQYILRLTVRRWWLILASTVLCGGAALAYASIQTRIYQASTTAFIYPVHLKGATAASVSSSVQFLAYSTFVDTFNTLAESRALLTSAAGQLSGARTQPGSYRVVSVALPGAGIIQISVQGPSAATAATLANRLVVELEAVATKYYPAYGLRSLDRALPPTTPIRPRRLADLTYGTVAGLILGFVFAALSVGAMWSGGRGVALAGNEWQAPDRGIEPSGERELAASEER